MTRSVGGGISLFCQRKNVQPAAVGKADSRAGEGSESEKTSVEVESTSDFAEGTTTDGDSTRVLLQHEPPARITLVDRFILCRTLSCSLPWLGLPQQFFFGPCVWFELWQQGEPAEEDEQQEPPQQHELFLGVVPRQTALCWPFGQAQAKCGTPANSVAAAVNQMNPD